MKVLLTGATGFIGSQLARRLVNNGYEVAIVVRPSSHLEILQEERSKIQVFVYNNSYVDLFRALEVARPEVVIHLASLALFEHDGADIASLIESNLSFPTQLLEAMSSLGICKFVNTGSYWQHYQNHDYDPVNLYAATKQAFEALLEYFVSARCMRVITLKLFDTFGPGDTRPKLFSLLRKSVKSGETLRMSPGNQLLNIVYIDDVLNAFFMAITRLRDVSRVESYAVSNFSHLSLKEVVRIYGETVGRAVKVDWGGLPYRSREVMELWTNYALIPGWQIQVSLVTGIMRMEQDEQIGGLLAG